MNFLRSALIALAFIATAGFAAPVKAPLAPFTAHYRLLQGGQLIGTATLTLARAQGDTWTFTTESRGTAGLASLLGASSREVSTFTWDGDLPQGLDYDYTLQSALKTRRREVRFDWQNHTVEVNDNGEFRFPTQPGALERHTVPLALAAGLAQGDQRFPLRVAVRDRIEIQQYTAQGQQPVSVPAGTFDATRVSRSDGGDGIEAWFAPAKLPAPVKIAQTGKHGFVLELERWSQP